MNVSLSFSEMQSLKVAARLQSEGVEVRWKITAGPTQKCIWTAHGKTHLLFWTDNYPEAFQALCNKSREYFLEALQEFTVIQDLPANLELVEARA